MKVSVVYVCFLLFGQERISVLSAVLWHIFYSACCLLHETTAHPVMASLPLLSSSKVWWTSRGSSGTTFSHLDHLVIDGYSNTFAGFFAFRCRAYLPEMRRDKWPSFFLIVADTRFLDFFIMFCIFANLWWSAECPWTYAQPA